MRIGIPREIHEGEMRVATTPEVVADLLKLGFTVAVEHDAGAGGSFDDDAYRKAGAEVVDDTRQLWSSSDIVMKVRAPEPHPALGVHEVDLLHEGQTLIAFLWPAQNPDLVKRLAEKGVTSLSMDSVPRISRAQKMDALSSMANVAGYRAVIEAAEHFGRFFTGQITAAGRIPPAKVLVIGAGVAGLAAIGAARSLGAIVRAFDTRPEVKEQVESMGGEFLELDFKEEGAGVGGYAKVMSPEFIKAEMALFAAQAKDVDIIITTALIPGKPAPKLITADMVASMKPGSVVVDLAAEQGGNCELTEPGQRGAQARRHARRLHGPAEPAGRAVEPALRHQPSPSAVGHVFQEGWRARRRHDRRGRARRHRGQRSRGHVAAASAEALGGAGEEGTPSRPNRRPPLRPPKRSAAGPIVMALVAALALAGIGMSAPPEFLAHFTVFVLAVFVGYMVVWNVTPALHTPLMSVTNAISSIIIIGALVQISSPVPLVMWMAGITVAITSVNIAGGFAVTQRMLQMFRK